MENENQKIGVVCWLKFIIVVATALLTTEVVVAMINFFKR
jgi:hypothetical protein